MAYTTITDPSAHFQSVLWTGNDSASRAITNTGNSNLQPDLVWIKKRNAVRSHSFTDTSRGLNKRLETDDTGSETTTTNNVLSAQSDGFTVGDNGSTNANNDTYVGWQWKANGGTEVTNNDGSVTTYVQLNSTAGFSIVKWTGNGNTSGTIGHGLGAIPDMIIRRDYSVVTNWAVAFPKQETSKLMVLNNTTAFGPASGMSGYTSTVFTDGSGSDSSSSIAYCYKNIKGFSKFGYYTGNGSSNGAFVYTGFKPAFVMIKAGSKTGEWVMLTGKIATVTNSNPLTDAIYANSSDAETGVFTTDFLSNGFKLRHTSGATSTDGETYTYMAFAQNPLVATNGVPATAR